MYSTVVKIAIFHNASKSKDRNTKIGIGITRKIEFKKQYVAMAGIIYTINNDFILLSNNIFGIINTKLLLIIIKL